ncbi:hypothetical protein Tsubulata_005775, partial [Turnera subulata]
GRRRGRRGRRRGGGGGGVEASPRCSGGERQTGGEAGGAEAAGAGVQTSAAVASRTGRRARVRRGRPIDDMT